MLKDKSQTAELWEKLNFGNKDQNVKFRKLMGIKVSKRVASFKISGTSPHGALKLSTCALNSMRCPYRETRRPKHRNQSMMKA